MSCVSFVDTEYIIYQYIEKYHETKINALDQDVKFIFNEKSNFNLARKHLAADTLTRIIIKAKSSEKLSRGIKTIHVIIENIELEERILFVNTPLNIINRYSELVNAVAYPKYPRESNCMLWLEGVPSNYEREYKSQAKYYNWVVMSLLGFGMSNFKIINVVNSFARDDFLQTSGVLVTINPAVAKPIHYKISSSVFGDLVVGVIPAEIIKVVWMANKNSVRDDNLPENRRAQVMKCLQNIKDTAERTITHWKISNINKQTTGVKSSYKEIYFSARLPYYNNLRTEMMKRGVKLSIYRLGEELNKSKYIKLNGSFRSLVINWEYFTAQTDIWGTAFVFEAAHRNNVKAEFTKWSNSNAKKYPLAHIDLYNTSERIIVIFPRDYLLEYKQLLVDIKKITLGAK